MYVREIPHRQLTAWLCAAIIPTAIQLTACAAWLSVLAVSFLCLGCVWLRWSLGAEPKGKIMALLQWGLLVLVLAVAAQASVKSWPRGGHPAVAAMLLLLAAWSAWKGTSAAARVGCVLFWFVVLLYLVLLGAGVKDVQFKWLLPISGEINGIGCVLLLTPAAAAIHLNKKETLKPRLLLIGAFCIAASVITLGVLSPQVAAIREDPFYEMTRSLSLLGQARRFEAVLSAGMTVGWFSVFTLCLTLCARWAEKYRTAWGRKGILGAAVAALAILLCELHISGSLLLVLCAIFWVLIPLSTQWIDPEKKSEKSENSA